MSESFRIPLHQGKQRGTSPWSGRGSGRARDFLGPALELCGLWHCDPVGLEVGGVSETRSVHGIPMVYPWYTYGISIMLSFSEGK